MTDGSKRTVQLIAGAMAIGIIAYQIPTLIEVAQRPDWNGYGGTDFEIYLRATRNWLASGQFYLTHQLAGPYQITLGDVLYPPLALWLFMPFTVLPAFLWWAIPLGVSAYIIWQLRPAPIAWPLMALCLWGPVQIHVISGNPDLWAMMFLALATRWPFFGPFVFLKPSVGPFGLWGIRHRGWWAGLAVVATLSLALLPMWPDWLRVVLDSRGGGLLYSWQEAPIMFIPVIAWLTRPGGRYGLRSDASRLPLAQTQLGQRVGHRARVVAAHDGPAGSH